jgi:hypothetical protein
MLFQTHYFLDPFDDFEPYLTNFGHACVTDKGRECSLQISYQAPQELGESSQLHVLLNKHVRAVPDEVAAVFQEGNRGSDRQRSQDRPDGFQDYPSTYRSFVLDLHREMDGIASDVFNTLRWRLGIDGGPLRLASRPESIRWDNEEGGASVYEQDFLRRQIPTGIIELTFPESQELTFSEAHRHAVEELLAKEAIQPLHHDLFREAWQNRGLSPRSALVVGIAALETALKTTICELHEPCRWILENLPSPPVEKILREYVQQLPARNELNGKVQRPPTALITLISKGIKQRNNLVHGREEVPDLQELKRLLEAIRDVLYLLDYYRGHGWAVERIRPEVVHQLLSE